MATAPFLLLIVAALPRVEAAPIATITHEARAPIATVAARVAVCENDVEKCAQLAVAPAPVAPKPARPKLIAALPTPPLFVEVPPLLAPRVEPGEPRGPPR